MADELDKTVANAFWLGTNKFQWDATGNYIEASSIVKGLNDIAAAIRSRWCWPLGTKHVFIAGIDKCMNCDQPKPGPATGEERKEE